AKGLLGRPGCNAMVGSVVDQQRALSFLICDWNRIALRARRPIERARIAQRGRASFEDQRVSMNLQRNLNGRECAPVNQESAPPEGQSHATVRSRIQRPN